MNSITSIKSFVSLIEATVPEIESLSFTKESNICFYYYRLILLYYYRNDTNNLSLMLKQIKKEKSFFNSTDEFEIVKRLGALRFQIRKNKILLSTINSLLDLKETISPKTWDLWSGEIYGIIAFAYGELSELELSNKFYWLSIEGFKKISANKKRTRAFHNYIATISCIDNRKCLIKEFFSIFKQAYKNKSFDFAALALGNIAREYQSLGMLNIADRYSMKALKYTVTNPFTLQTYLTKLYRAHILIDLGRPEEARALIDHCHESVYPEIRGGALILRIILNKSKTSLLNLSKKYRLLPEWKTLLQQNLSESNNKSKPTKMEEKLIYFISLKVRTKDQILKHLFGDRIDKESSNNRFHVLLSRIKSKWPNLLITHSNSTYTLT